ncbi:MAG: tRNA (adenosine(37)-N6)-threonylcarbamoyltransferase complex dimerization subunit type 1 TsaB [Gammaproteobacteria bacterium]|nr:tRNA (adenosine(37)-N6)-threonylcarbamoyltransferase complex dimerization subunit type 1 TsaB [Gammaproteobacteria bacterium]
MAESGRILALDTVTEGCSAALLVGGVLSEKFEHTPRGHTQHILPMVDQLLVEAGCSLQQLDAIAFDRGPGSFTGLRITAGVVQGLAYGADLPVIPVSSLATLALGHFRAHQQRNILVAMDARMGEVYWGCYQINASGVPQLQGEELVISPDALVQPAGEWVGIGSGWREYGEVLGQQRDDPLVNRDGEAVPHAADVALLGEIAFQQGALLSAAEAQPLYLRNQVVQTQR